MSEKRQKLVEAADIISEVRPHELEAPNPKAELTRSSIEVIEDGVRQIAKQLPEEE